MLLRPGCLPAPWPAHATDIDRPAAPAALPAACGAGRRRAVARATLALATAALAACSVTLPPRPASAPVPDAFASETRTADPTSPGSPAAPDDGRWWRVFDDPRLDALQQRAMAHNPHIAEAAAQVDQARALAGLAAADAQPQLALNAGASRQGGPLINDAGGSGTLWRVGLGLQFTPDIDGSRSAAARAALHDIHQRQAHWQQARLEVQVRLASHWLAAQALAQELPWLRALAAHWAHSARLEERRVAAGLAPPGAADSTRAQAAAADARWQAALQQAAAHRHAMTALLGGVPVDVAAPDVPPGAEASADGAALPPLPDARNARDARDAPDLDDPRASALPPRIPPGLPSRLLARRPDVAAAEQAVEAARLRLGVARAAGWPVLRLTSAGGVASDELGTLLRSAARSWSLAGLLTLPLLDGGRRDAQQAAAEAELALAAAR